MAQGANTNGQSQPVYITNADGTAASGGGGAATGPGTSAQATRVTPATDGDAFPIAGVANSGFPTLISNGQRASIWTGAYGQPVVSVGLQLGPTGASATTLVTMPVVPGGNAFPMATAGYVYTGTDVVPTRGDNTGTYVVPGILPAGTDRSGTAGTTASQLAAANTARRKLLIQNIGTGNLGVNQVGGTAAIGTAGTHTIPANGSIEVTTNRAISVIAVNAATPYTAIEI